MTLMPVLTVALSLAGLAALAEVRDFSIADYGAKADGSKCTDAFAAAFAAAEKAGGGRIIVPCGRWFSGAVRFKSNCELHLAEGAEILFSQDPADYLPAVHTSWEGMECWNYCPLVYAYCCTNVAITGTGTLRAFDGEWKDTAWYPWVPQENGVRAARRQLYDWGAQDVPVAERQIWKTKDAHTRPHFVQFNRCKNVCLEGFRIRNSPFWTLHLFLCEDVEVHGLDVCAHGNNNDGIDIEMSRNVAVEDCTFDQGDDGVVIKSGRNHDAWKIGVPTENVSIRNCYVKNAHTVLGVGSEISGGVRNVHMRDCRAETPNRVFFLKTNRRRGAFLEDISCENVTCREVRDSVFEIDMDVLYEWAKFPDYRIALTRISNILAKDIRVGATKNLIDLKGDPRLPPRDIRVENVTADRIAGKRCQVKNVYGFVEDGMPNFALPRLTDSGDALSKSVYDRVFNRVVAADRACDARWVSLKTPAAIAAFQREVREKAVAALGGFPERTPLNGRTVGTLERPGCRIEKVLFESRPDFLVTGHLYVPTDPKFKAPFPALCAPCGHSFAGKAAPWYSHTGIFGAERGFVVLVYDPVDQGERYQKRDGRTTWSSTAEHNCIGVRAFLLGESAAQVRLFDGMRAIDYLASRTDVVDPKKIGVAGISGGGTLSSYVNAFEPQVACGSPSGFLSTVRDVFDNCGPQDAEQVIFGQLTYGLNHLGIVCLRAPSPILVSTSHSDFFPFIGSTDLAEKARKVFAAAGAPDRMDLLSVPGPHHWYTSQKDVQFAWMSKWLEGRPEAYAEDKRTVRWRHLGSDYCGGRGGLAYETPETRNVTETGFVLDRPGARSIYDIYREKLAALKAARAELTPARVRALTGIRPLAKLAATAVKTEGGVILVREDDETLMPIVVSRPAKASDLPPVLIVSDAGSRTELAKTVRACLADGRTVAVADIRGFGETSGSRHPFYGKKDGDEEIACCLMALGDSIVARRAEDVALVARQVAEMLGAKPVLRAEGRAAVPAAHAKYLEPELFAGFETVRAPASWEKLVADETIAYPFSCTVRGALAAYDWTDLN